MVVADAHAEVFAGHVFDLVRFVEHHGGVFGNDAAEIVVLHRQVGEEQVMIDDDDVALMRAAVHFGQEAALELLALLAGAQIAARVQLLPGGAGFGQRLDLGAIAGGGGLLPFADDLKVGDFFQAAQNRLAIGVVDLLPAGEVGAALHVADLQRPVEMLLQERNVFVEELLLQVLGSGGDHHAFAGEQGRDQIGERFAGAGARVDQQMLFLGQRGLDGFGHLELSGTKLVARVPSRKHSVPGKELPRGERFRGRRHPF